LNGSSPGPFGYKAQAGYYRDSESGLQLLTYRYYDPSTGRFLTRDPSGYSGGINLYNDVTNNPVSLSDPLGLDADGWGNDLADAWDRVVESWRVAFTSDPDAVNFNTAINYAAGTWRSAADPFRIGSGAGNALYNPCAQHPVMDVLKDGLRAGQIAALIGGAASGIIGRGGAAVEGDLPGLPASAQKPLGLGSTGRVTPANLSEQLAMEHAMSNPSAGRLIKLGGMSDARWPGNQGWIKLRQRINGHEIHYVVNGITGAIDDFKFK
jgi:RHS repeat-associated protein